MATPARFVEFSRQRGLAAGRPVQGVRRGARTAPAGPRASGMLVLERLSDARRNGHQVLAVVRGRAVNQDGASQRADRAERPVAAAGDPAGAGQRRAVAVATWTRWRRTAPGRRWATRSRRRRCWPRTGRTAGGPAAVAGLDEVEHRPHPGGRRGRRGDQDGAGDAARGAAARRCTSDEPSPHVDWSPGAVRLLTERRPWPATGPAAPGGGVVVRHQRHQRARDPGGGARARGGGRRAGRRRRRCRAVCCCRPRATTALRAQADRLLRHCWTPTRT